MYCNYFDAYETKKRTVFDRGIYKLASNAYGSESLLVSRWIPDYSFATTECGSNAPTKQVEKYSKFHEKTSNIFKVSNIFITVSKFLNKLDAENFEKAFFQKKIHDTLKIFPIFLIISKYLDDEDKAAFHAAVNPGWKPFFYYKQNVDWKLVSKSWNFSLDELEKFKDVICWENTNISTNNLWKFRHVVNWPRLCESRYFYAHEVEKFKLFIDFTILQNNQKIAKRFRNIDSQPNQDCTLKK
jgi:hypothetical protein